MNLDSQKIFNLHQSTGVFPMFAPFRKTAMVAHHDQTNALEQLQF